MSKPDPTPMQFDDPHMAPQDAEVTRVRSLTGVWRALLICSAALTIWVARLTRSSTLPA